ncbi:hypothetical protein PFICI_02315 [Pestalotiopsis fici W106-1]|uniref:Clr5 domain-containing protein n=1 Tax=Pestalotiopsis fici (strain W106-1 / CGMCC3.15140) TaxID=1229662 RepID=W3XE22_PESFW|nr:uncharacterized protein PFICI_02315 [Pestalotiopsis fici W106-1]ETS84290.1 hypothetical protein PFICI_02315 [Pestalotiopsis fici W106-1]
MYKKYIRKWGIRKNLRSIHVVDILRKDPNIGFNEVSTRYTGLVDAKRVQVYLHRLSEKRRQQIEIEAVAHGDGGHLTGRLTPSLNVVTFTTTAPERYLHHVQDYIRGTFTSGTWSKLWAPNSTSYARNFYLIDLAITAKNAFIHGYSSEAFGIIHLAFSQLGPCMRSDTVDMLACIHWVGLIYYSFSPETAGSWFKYSIGLSRIIYASGHYPQYQTAWIEQLGEIEIEQWIHVSVRAIEFNMRNLCKHLINDGRPKSDFVPLTAMLISRTRGMGAAVIPPADFANVGRLTWEGFGCVDLEDSWTKFALAGVLFDEGKYSKAKGIAEDILKMNKADNRQVVGLCFRILFLIAMKTGNMDDAMFWARESTSFWTTHLDAENELTIDAIYDMQELLRSRGDVGAARDCQKHISTMLNRRCERIQREIHGYDVSSSSSEMLASSNIVGMWITCR